MPNTGQEKLQDLMDQIVSDLGAAMSAPLVVIGDRLGLYRALHTDGPLTSLELASKTSTTERYVREWLRAQAAGGYVTYHPEADRYSLSPEQSLVLAQEDSPFFSIGGFNVASAATKAAGRITEAFRSGGGMGWHEHDPDLFHGTERFFRPGYIANLVDAWIPALEGVTEKLERGARVADVGCGHGASTILMAKAFPNSTFTGFDFHPNSIETARQRAAGAGLNGNVRFEEAKAKEFDSGPYDLITVFDCLHDMGDPLGAARHVLKNLAHDGTWMIVEPYASDRVEENLNPLGRVSYSASTMFCTPCSLDQEIGMALGAQAGEGRLREIAEEAGFSRFRRVAETPFNLVLEARP